MYNSSNYSNSIAQMGNPIMIPVNAIDGQQYS
jgi:hypothetical protein